jgi:hypothetical protein
VRLIGDSHRHDDRESNHEVSHDMPLPNLEYPTANYDTNMCNGRVLQPSFDEILFFVLSYNRKAKFMPTASRTTRMIILNVFYRVAYTAMS